MRQKTGTLALVLLLVPGVTLARAQAQTGEEPAPVTYERLLQDEAEAENWLTYSGGYHSHRYSRLDEINRDNVGKLRVEWVHQVETMLVLETNPIVADGVMYITEPPSDVVALDVRTGRPFWAYRHKLSTSADKICCGPDNRGVALLDGRVYIGTIDARLVALDARSGHVLWDVEVADPEAGYSITSAPLAIQDKIVTGIAGGEYGIRGFLDAYDAETGERAWRFYTVPAPGEPGNETWGNDSWRTGGAPTWVTGAYDPERNLVYWGTGNPAPDWNGDLRPGDNLYSDSVVAVDGDTGELRWYFQFTPHDTHDWDACQTPILVDAMWEGSERPLMYWANRNGFYYVLDRETGAFLTAREFSKQTWAEGLDERGRPIVRAGSDPTEEGTLVYPSCCATANWWPSTYSPRTGLYYTATTDGGAVYYKGEDEYTEGDQYLGSTPVARDEIRNDWIGAIRALDALTGELKWEFSLEPSSVGLTSTAGGLVFGGSRSGYVFALDDTTGQELWYFYAGRQVHASPVTYVADGEQRVSIAVGNSIFTFALPD